MRQTLEHLEMHIAHACNLRCKFCTHYCDIGYGGLVPHAVGAEWLKTWSRRVRPERFYLLGGEPLLNPELDLYLRTARECFPDSKRLVVTNGLLLTRIESILPVFIETGTRLHISIHPIPRSEEARLTEGLALAERWLRRGLLVSYRGGIQNWYAPYRDEGPAIKPYADDDARASFAALCGKDGKSCVNLHEGKLWKCPALAFLPMVIDKLEHRAQWEPYLQYRPLAPEAGDEELAKFIALDAEFCDICPAGAPPALPPEVLTDHGRLVVLEPPQNRLRFMWRGLGKARQWLRRGPASS